MKMSESVDSADAACGNCAFYSHLETECRKSPPTPYPMPTATGQITIVSVWPNMKAHHWCGEWSRRYRNE